MQQRLAQKEKEKKEETLRNLAQKAREERTGKSEKRRDGDDDSDGSGEEDKIREREDLRRERQRDRERELRMSRMGAEQRAKHVAKQAERDISEKIALGLAKPTVTRDSMFDARLFNQSEGLNSGFGAADSYDVYDKPLFNAAATSASIYKVRKSKNDDQFGGGTEEGIAKMLKVDRFGKTTGANRGFLGADQSEQRDGPVQFTREEDPFGVDQFLDQAKKGKRAAEHGLETSKRAK